MLKPHLFVFLLVFFQITSLSLKSELVTDKSEIDLGKYYMPLSDEFLGSGKIDINERAVLTITNNSEKVIIITKIDILYTKPDAEFTRNDFNFSQGNLNFFDSNNRIESEDTVLFSIIPKVNNEELLKSFGGLLEADLVLEWRYVDSFDIYKSIIKLKVELGENPRGLFFINKQSGLSVPTNPALIDSSRTVSLRNYLLNATDNDFIIDSVKYDYQGKNWIRSGFYLPQDSHIIDAVEFPYILKANSLLVYYIYNYTHHWEDGFYNTTIYGRHEGAEEAKVIHNKFTSSIYPIPSAFRVFSLSGSDGIFEERTCIPLDSIYKSNQNNLRNNSFSDLKVNRIRILTETDDNEYTSEELNEVIEHIPFIIPAGQNMIYTHNVTAKVPGKGKSVLILIDMEHEMKGEFQHSALLKYDVCEPMSISQYVKPEGVEIYPNPASNELFIASVNHNFDSYQIFDMSGKKLQSGILHSNFVNTESLSAGSYVLVLYSYKGYFTNLNFIKQ